MASRSRDVLAGLDPPVPVDVAAWAEGWTVGAVAAVPVPSASVVLLRDGPTGLETYLLHRHSRMSFAASMAVFPGGGMDEADRAAARSAGVDELRVCAVRETAEETGVRLDPAELLEWAHWTTPRVQPRRFDTRFYVAVLPASQTAADLSGETDRAEWTRPRDAVESAVRGEIALMPPTLSILTELARVGGVEEVLELAHDRVVEPVFPEVVRTESGWAFDYAASVVEQIAPYLRLARAPNPGPMTLEGTNTWIVGTPGAGPCLVVDPGPNDSAHLERVIAACRGAVAAVVLTHWHLDHSEVAAHLARAADCGVRAAHPDHRIGPDGLASGDTLEVVGADAVAYATPGHTSDSISLLVTGSDGVARLLTGDMVLGRGTTVIMHPDGNLAAYFDSLRLMQRLVAEHHVAEILPGHGPRVREPADWLRYYESHRRERLAQVRAALAAGDTTAKQVVARVYADVDRSVWPAAERSVEAQMEYLTGS